MIGAEEKLWRPVFYTKRNSFKSLAINCGSRTIAHCLIFIPENRALFSYSASPSNTSVIATMLGGKAQNTMFVQNKRNRSLNHLFDELGYL